MSNFTLTNQDGAQVAYNFADLAQCVWTANHNIIDAMPKLAAGEPVHVFTADDYTLEDPTSMGISIALFRAYGERKFTVEFNTCQQYKQVKFATYQAAAAFMAQVKGGQA